MGYAGEPPTVSIAIDNSVTPFSVLDPEPEEFLPKLKSAGEVTTFHALNRELACAALDQHTGTYSRQKVSAQAYCAAYVIAKRYGVDVTGFNLEYIAQRNECGKKDPQELRDFLNDVRQASYSIRNHIERNFGAKEQEYITDEFAIGDPVLSATPGGKFEP